LTSRYLELVKSAVLDELYIENELRIEHLLEASRKGRSPDPDRLRDPMRAMRVRATRLLTERRSGTYDPEGLDVPPLAMTTVGRVRLDHLQQCIETVASDELPGDVVECEPGRGGVGALLRAALDGYGLGDRLLWIAGELLSPPRGEADLNAVRDTLARLQLFDERVRFLQGRCDASLADAPIDQVSLLHVGALGSNPESILASVYDRVVDGGFIVVDGLHQESVARAVDAFRDSAAVAEPIERIDWSSICWRKATPAASVVSPASTPSASTDLSVVVVFYNMRREAARTLQSLTRSYQRGIDYVDYEVVVVENGSSEAERLGEEYVRGFGPEFRYIDMGEAATPSPVGALNAGIAGARGDAIALMIDGAHVLTPGVLRFGLAGLRTYAPALVATQQWYVGPGQQPDAMLAGYDQTYEDELFEQIEWPTDGYRLFDIGHFIGDRDWLDGMWESNCLFVPRRLIEQSGAFDPSFSMPGGGYANLELYERLGSTPGVTSVTILGEGSFHQAHGGTTTNQPEVDARHGELASYEEHFSELRGRSYKGHGQFTHYVGAMRPNTMRSRSRRRTAPSFFKGRQGTGIDGIPEHPRPIPQDLKADFVEAFWDSLAWRQVSWLGWRVPKAPTDLFAYQELIQRVRPDWIIETGPGAGGRTLFLASICELLDHGTVLSIDPTGPANRPEHPRITYVTGVSHDESTAAEVRSVVGDEPHALVILGTRGSRQRVLGEFELLAPLVPVGSYVIVEDTIVNGHPVWPGAGPGPMEAVKSIVNRRANFASDHDLEKYGLTFNPNGYLKRVR
jgi:cephalosporin hydroxylase